MPIRCRAGDSFGADNGLRAWTIVDHDILSQQWCDPISHKPCRHIG
jgi:hypothetical protein